MKTKMRLIKAEIWNQIINHELKILESQCQVLIILGFYNSFSPFYRIMPLLGRLPNDAHST